MGMAMWLAFSGTQPAPNRKMSLRIFLKLMMCLGIVLSKTRLFSLFIKYIYFNIIKIFFIKS